MRVCRKKRNLAKVFGVCGSRIFFCETHHFHDFALRNRENDVSHKI